MRILTAGKSGHARKKTEWLSAGVVVCLEQGADLHTAQLMPLLLTVSCSSKIQIGFTFLVPAHLGSTGQRAVKRVCVCFFYCLCTATYRYLLQLEMHETKFYLLTHLLDQL